MSRIDARTYFTQYVKNDRAEGWLLSRYNVGVHVRRDVMKLVDGDAFAAMLLSQILYYHDLDTNGKPRISHVYDGHLWIVKTYEEWRDELGFKSAKTVRNCFDRLSERGVITKEQHKSTFPEHRGKVVTFVRLNWDILSDLLGLIDSDVPNRAIQEIPERAIQEIPERAIHNTETTTENTAERENRQPIPFEEVSEAIYDTVTPAIAQRILELPTHLKRSRMDGIRIPLIEAFGEAIGSKSIPEYADKVRALEATIAGYTPDDMKALVQHKLATRKSSLPYCLKWALDDLPSFKAKATPAPLPRYRTMSEPDEPPTLSVMSEEDRQHALNLIAARKARMAQESADATEKAS